MKYFLTLFILLLNFSSQNLYAQTTQEIRGKILDEETQKPVPFALIEILNSDLKTETDETGEFVFSNLPPETYQLKISALGYEPVIKTDLILYGSKPLQITINLIPKGFITEEIDVDANYFQKSSDINVSFMNLDYEEIRRAPGAVEDISRMFQSAPGVSIGNDQRNDLIVRGGSPSENLILIDGIEIPNINHFGTQGSSSGAISFINSKFILDANMFTGGFPVIYGDRLSSVLDIHFREGNRKNHYQDINLSMAGFGGIFEGPLTSKGSYMFSVRRSYLELIQSAIRLSAVPNYWDFNLKATHEFSPTDRLTLIGFAGIDKVTFSTTEEDNNPYGRSNARQNSFATGLNYTKLIKNGFIQTVLSNSYANYKIDQLYSDIDKLRFMSNSSENETTLKSDLNYQLSKSITLNIGIGAKYIFIKNNLFLDSNTSPAGYYYNTIDAHVDTNTYKFFTHLNLTYKLFNDRLNINTGLRYDYFDYIRLKSVVSPRLGVSYQLTGVTSLSASWGIFYQSPQYLWITSHPNNWKLNNIRSEHYIAGIEHFFDKDLRATLEVYQKNYKDYPVWKDIPYYILIDGGADNGPNIVGEAVSAGTGYIRGIDFSLQKKLTETGLYGLINYSYSFSKFKALAGNEKPGEFDPGHQFTLIAGYQFKNDWLVGVKFKYAGGRPYTPFNIDSSTYYNHGIFSTSDYNSARYPYYMRFDVRVDKKFNIKKISIVGYLEIQNLFNKDNIYNYFWNENKNRLGTIYQWAFFPVGGISVQF